jgi:hypothetical protein
MPHTRMEGTMKNMVILAAALLWTASASAQQVIPLTKAPGIPELIGGAGGTTGKTTVSDVKPASKRYRCGAWR